MINQLSVPNFVKLTKMSITSVCDVDLIDFTNVFNYCSLDLYLYHEVFDLIMQMITYCFDITTTMSRQ